MKESISNKRLCGRVVKAVDSSSTIVKMHEFEPRRSHYFFNSFLYVKSPGNIFIYYYLMPYWPYTLRVGMNAEPYDILRNL